MINTKYIFSQSRMTQAVLGVSKEEFDKLLPVFGQCLTEHRIELYPDRQRFPGGGRKGDLPTNQDKLIYILLYVKLYPTFDALSVLANHYRSKCQDSVKLLLPVLEKTLGRNLALPVRTRKSPGNSLEEIFRQHPEIKDVFIDGSERKVQRPKNLKKRNRLYSGKKKSATRKNVIISDAGRYIHFMSKTKSGRRHDKRIADKENIFGGIPPDIPVWTDTGFQGAQKQHDNIVMPAKATKNHPLTQEQKENNHIISSIRVISEHAIAGYKKFKAASDTYRNKLVNFDDMLTEVAIGLHNFHLLQTA